MEEKPSDSADGNLESTKIGAFHLKGFRNHVASDGFWLGVSGKWSACGWSVVHLGHDVEMEPMHGMYGTMGADFVVQRRTKRAEQTTFLCLLRRRYRSHDGARWQ